MHDLCPSLQAAATAGGLATTASLERVMDGLGEGEKYNAVLQGVSGLLMGKKKAGAGANGAFEEVFQLLDEMHINRIKCTLRTASAVVDAATATTNIGIITEGTACIMYALILDRTIEEGNGKRHDTLFSPSFLFLGLSSPSFLASVLRSFRSREGMQEDLVLSLASRPTVGFFFKVLVFVKL